MSKTPWVSYRGRGFWAYSFGLGALLGRVVDEFDNRYPDVDQDLLRQDCCMAIEVGGSGLGFEIGREWTVKDLERFAECLSDACVKLESEPTITLEQTEAFGSRLEKSETATAPIVELGRAIQALMSGDLPEPPAGRMWMYGAPEGRITLAHG